MTNQVRPLSETFATSQSSLPDSLNRLWEYVFGSGVHRPLLPGVTVAELLTAATLVAILFALHGVVGPLANRWSRWREVPDLRRRWHWTIVQCGLQTAASGTLDPRAPVDRLVVHLRPAGGGNPALLGGLGPPAGGTRLGGRRGLDARRCDPGS